MFVETIGMTVAEVVKYLITSGYTPTVVPETEDEYGYVTTRIAEYGEGFDFTIVDGYVDEYEFIFWA